MLCTYRMIAVLGLTLAVASAPAISSDNTFKKSTELEKRTAKTSEDVDKYAIQLDKTERALFHLSQGEGKELRKRYKSFSREVDNLAEAQKHATSAIDEMASKGTEYFLQWGKSIAQILDPELKQSSMERRSKLMQKHDDLATTLSDIGHQLPPFMKNLRDIEAFLGADLTPANVSNASGMIQNCRDNARTLGSRIAGVQITLKGFLNEASK